jgi:hypothetical protein
MPFLSVSPHWILVLSLWWVSVTCLSEKPPWSVSLTGLHGKPHCYQQFKWLRLYPYSMCETVDQWIWSFFIHFIKFVILLVCNNFMYIFKKSNLGIHVFDSAGYSHVNVFIYVDIPILLSIMFKLQLNSVIQVFQRCWCCYPRFMLGRKLSKFIQTVFFTIQTARF